MSNETERFERLHNAHNGIVFFEKLAFPFVHTFNLELCAEVIDICEGISMILAQASWNEFHCVTVGTISFLSLTSSRHSDVTMERVVFVHSAEHLCVAL